MGNNLKMNTNRISFVCKRASDLRKNKSVIKLSQHEAFIIANKEWKNNLINIF